VTTFDAKNGLHLDVRKGNKQVALSTWNN